MNSLKAFVVDYGAGNLASVLRFLEDDLLLSTKVGKVLEFNSRDSDLLIIPGVGNFGPAASALASQQFQHVLDRFIESGRMVIGICLGAQLLGYSSQESSLPVSGLRLLPFECLNLRRHPIYKGKVPRTGWSSLEYDGNPYSFYYVHSYYINPLSVSPDNKTADLRICSCLQDRVPGYVTSSSINVHALQFHPEKSSIDGRRFVSKLLLSYA